MIRAVAVAARPPTVPDLTAIAVGPLSVWFRTVQAAEQAGEALVADADLLAAQLAAGASPLPLHASARYDDTAALAADVTARSAELLDAVTLVQGQVEVAVRVTRAGDDDDSSARTGTEHMRRLVEKHRRDADLRQRLADTLGDLARAVRHLPSRDAQTWRGAALVRRDALGSVPGRVAKLEHDLGPGVRVSCTGPWPAYSFGPGSTAGRLEPVSSAAGWDA